MQFSPGAPGSHVVLSLQPFAGAVDFQPGAVDQQMDRPVGQTAPLRHGRHRHCGVVELIEARKKGPPVFGLLQIFTDTGMPKLVILFSADALIHASVFCCGSARAFIALPKMRL